MIEHIKKDFCRYFPFSTNQCEVILMALIIFSPFGVGYYIKMLNCKFKLFFFI